MTDPRSDRTIGYHLFIEPAGAIAAQLQQMIGDLAASFDGPAFPPHVTVLARIVPTSEAELLERCAALAQAQKPFDLVLGEPGMEDAYFRALYLKAQESEALNALHAEANEAFGMEDGAGYMPHLSLLYGLYDEERKRAAVAALPVPGTLSFRADRLSLYRTEGRAQDWQKLQEFPFGS